MKVTLLQAAIADITRLRTFIEPKSPGAAKKAVDAILDTCASLDLLPNRGQLRDDGTRRLIVPFGNAAYVIRYRVDDSAGEVFIIQIKHSREQ